MNNVFASKILAYAVFLLAFVLSSNSLAKLDNDARAGDHTPNILWLVLEDMSPILPDYGDDTIETPNISRLANEGVKYTNVYSTSGVCAPSRAALALGMYPSAIGANNMRTTSYTEVTGLPKYGAVPPPEAKMLSQYMRELGYYTANNYKTDYQFRAPDTAWNESGIYAHWRNRGQGQPFFSVVNFTTTHESGLFEPYGFREVENRHYFADDAARIAKLPQNHTFKTAEANTPVHLPHDTDFEIPPYLPDTPLVRRDFWKMYNNLAEVDRQIGAVLAQLEQDGLLDSTIVVFYTDHGGPLPRQKRLIYDSGLKVPMIIRYPNGRYAGTVDDQLVSFIDFAPTTLKLAGMEVPAHMHGQNFIGNGEATRKYIHAAADRFDGFTDRIRAVKDKQFKYIRNYRPEQPYYLPVTYRERIPTMQELLRLRDAGELTEAQAQWFRQTKPREELFDTLNDPHELNDLAADPAYAHKLSELSSEMDRWLAEVGDEPESSEAEVLAQLWKGQATQPQTADPILEYENGIVSLKCETEGASIGYQIIDKGYEPASWEIYTGPFEWPGDADLRYFAHRIGYLRSKTLSFKKLARIASARRGFEDESAMASKVNLSVQGELKQWHKVTIQFEGPEADELDTDVNPFLDYRFDLEVTHASGSPSYVIPGYFAADGDAGNTSSTSGNIWRAHFSPDKTGTWSYKTSFYQGPGVAIGHNGGLPVEQYHGIEGAFAIEESDKTGRDFRAQGRLEYVNKHHLQFAGSKKYFLKAGPDAPETLLAYTEFDNTETRLPKKGPLKTWEPHLKDWNPGDPTWKDGKGKALVGALNYLAEKGMNAFSFLTYNAGGDGDNVWPYVDRDRKYHFDVSKLDQWGILFDHAQANGLFLHFKLQENESDDNRFGPRKLLQLIPEALDGGVTGPERKLYLRELVARFGYHLALNWNLGEENTQTYEEQVEMAEYLQALDPYDHLIVIHTFPSQQDFVYNQLQGDASPVRGASTQNKWDAAHQFTLRWVMRSQEAGAPWIVPNDEQNPAGAGVPPDPGYNGFSGLSGDKFGNYDLHGIRKYTLWGNLMAGGAGVEYYFGYLLPENDLLAQDWRSRDRSWEYCRIALDFFQGNEIPFWEMKTDNVLVGNFGNENTVYCLANPGDTYVVYLPEGGTAELDLSGHKGSYDVRWYDPRNGGALQAGSVKKVKGGKRVSLGDAPSVSSDDWAILIRKR